MRPLLCFLLLTVSALAAPAPEINVFFSPNGGCTAEIVKQINLTKSNLVVQAYGFTSKDIAAAVVSAKKRGILVEVILDKSVRKQGYTEADFLAHSGVKVMIDARHSIAHNKVMVIDSETVITGSFNFTRAAETSNAENLLVIHDKATAEKYLKNWHDHEKHSEPYQGR